ncbi:glucuronyl hydrolase [Guyanagaster necrorhizus]|uniref:Glucuronyl hydrolase n=1 Tax=Guyanagaster necrorhizus TaxID=856835 RepID=A0A9P7W5V9_9AGAR|nr:glucuronyl hydrolase [Guyanagaster necrorhizus MCA 3950]KAG7453040.1 glucuronyl hydrolase [Guyanagaster necrorhizus MCA 3950]
MPNEMWSFIDILASAFLVAHLAFAQTVTTDLYSSLIPSKVLATANKLNNQFPQYTDSTAGVWQLFSADTWTSGFFPATLYALETRQSLCEATSANGLNAADWAELGRQTSAGLAPLTTSNSVGHDVGFLSFPYVEELSIHPDNTTAADIVNGFATYLAGRFNPTVGCTRSWDSSDPTDFVVIIDNMMNLNVLMVSAQLTGNSTLRDIATSHANTTMKNHIRDDGSTWHVVEYNATTGAVIDKITSQGYADNSTWSRGQAWAVYGYANMYNWTGDSNYLVTARHAATYFLDTLPSNGIVPWDFNAPVENRPADSSAATIVATGLLLLSKVETDPTNSTNWSTAAISILNNITSLAWDPSWESLLANGTVNKPANNYLTGTVYGDYYYIVAGNELISMGLANCTTLATTNTNTTNTNTTSPSLLPFLLILIPLLLLKSTDLCYVWLVPPCSAVKLLKNSTTG